MIYFPNNILLNSFEYIYRNIIFPIFELIEAPFHIALYDLYIHRNLHWLAESNNIYVFKFALSRTKDKKDQHNLAFHALTKICSAKIKENINIVNYALSKVTPESINKPINPILYLSKSKKNIELGETLLIKACKNNRLKTVEALLKFKKIYVNLSNGKENRTPLHYAAFCGHKEIVQMLLDHEEINVNAIDNFKKRPLHCAALKGHKEIVQMLLDHKEINVNAIDHIKARPLHYAAIKGHKEIVQILLNRKEINVNAIDNSISTPLHYAALKGHKEIVQMLLDHKEIKINAIDNNNTPLLSYAIDNNNTPPLSYAIAGRKNEIVWLLLNREEIDINIKDEKTGTLIIIDEALKYGDETIISKLFEMGANPIMVNEDINIEDSLALQRAMFVYNKYFQFECEEKTYNNELLKIEDFYDPSSDGEKRDSLEKSYIKRIFENYFFEIFYAKNPYTNSILKLRHQRDIIQNNPFYKDKLEEFNSLSNALASLLNQNESPKINQYTAFEILKFLSLSEISMFKKVIKNFEFERKDNLYKKISMQEENNLKTNIEEDFMLSQKFNFFMGSIFSRPLIKCSIDYAKNLYNERNYDYSYIQCIEKGYLTKEGWLENLSGVFLINSMSIMLIACGWPSLVDTNNYKFLDLLTQHVNSPALKGIISTATLEALPFIGDVVIDGVQYIGDSAYCMIFDCENL